MAHFIRNATAALAAVLLMTMSFSAVTSVPASSAIAAAAVPTLA